MSMRWLEIFQYFGEGGEGFVDVRVRMGEAQEALLKLRRRQPNAVFHHAVEEARIAVRV